MTNSSVQPIYSTISGSDTITLTGYNPADFSSINTTGTSISYPSYNNNCGTITISGSGGAIPSLTTSQISSLTINTSTFKIHLPEDWVDQFPDFNRVQKMCEEYPGLKIALEKFKTVYKLVKDHYDTPEDKRPRP
jgi:hypothetical protein